MSVVSYCPGQGLFFEQMKEFLLEQLEEDGGSERAKREVVKKVRHSGKSPTVV